MEISQTIRLTVEEDNLRLDRYISQSCKELSRSFIQKLIEEGSVTVNTLAAKPSLKTKKGDMIVIHLPPPQPPYPTLMPENLPLSIVYEDSDLMVIDKPAGITVHPAPGNPDHTLINAILAHYPDILVLDSSVRPGIVHRLDKNTSGLMVVAKKKDAQLNLASQLKNHRMLKKYLVLVRGRPSPEEGDIKAPIGRHPKNRKKMAVVPGGREAHTSYRVVKTLKNFTLVEAITRTGRTHQIRVHFSSIGCPVIGDDVYGVRVPYLGRQFLHACLLGFRLPGTGEWAEFHSELPTELELTLERLAIS